jgi:hypothetical protein
MRRLILFVLVVAALGVVALTPAAARAQTYVTGDSFTPVYQSAHETNVVYYTYPGRTYYSGPLVPRANFLNAHETNVYMGPSYYSYYAPGPYYYSGPLVPRANFLNAHETNVYMGPSYYVRAY